MARIAGVDAGAYHAVPVDPLGALRLILTHAEIEVVCRRAMQKPSRATHGFLAQWLELLDACAQPDAIARDLVADALLRAAPPSE